jgi:predicted permease
MRSMVPGLARDLRLAARRLLAAPLFTAFAVLSLAVGVGVTTAVYSVVDSIFWKDIGIRDPETALFITAPDSEQLRPAQLSQPDFEDIRASQKSFSSVGASQQVPAAAELPSKTELMNADGVSGEYFRTLGVGAFMGRTIEPQDEQGAAEVVVLSESMWRKRFNSDPHIVGRTLRLSGRPFEIIGVAPKEFDGALPVGPLATSLWVPLSTASSLRVSRPASGGETPARDRRTVVVLGRLRPGVSSGAAAGEILSIGAALDVSQPQHGQFALRSFTPRRWGLQTVESVQQKFTETLDKFGLVMVGLVALVLVVACTNLSNLVLARGIGRQQEFAIRRALGASRGRLVREQAAESVLIAIAGAIASYVVLQGLRYWMTTDFAIDQRWTLSIEPTVDLQAFVVSATAVLLSLVVFGFEPAFALTRSPDVKSDLGHGSGTVGVPKKQRQRALLRWQVAISAGFFIIATMCVKYTIAEVRHDPGIEMDGLGIAAVNFYTQAWDEPRVRRELDRVLDEARRQPEIESAAVSTGLPFGTRGGASAALGTSDKPILAGNKTYSAHVVAGTPALFRTLGVPILAGRGFDDRDQASSRPVVVINETAARAMFGTTGAVGRELMIQLNSMGRVQPVQTAAVVGIARETDGGRYLSDRRYPLVYMPFAQTYDPFITITARSRTGSESAVAALQKALRAANPDIALEYAGTARTVLAGPFVFLRAVGTTALSLGALTLLLAMVGLFGIQSHTVSFRTREIGVRMTFGASAGQIKRMVLKDGYVPVLQGLALGVFIGFTGRALIRSYLEGDMPLVDPWMFLVVPIPLLAAAFCACYWPARRASRLDPQTALRHL